MSELIIVKGTMISIDPKIKNNVSKIKKALQQCEQLEKIPKKEIDQLASYLRTPDCDGVVWDYVGLLNVLNERDI